MKNAVINPKFLNTFELPFKIHKGWVKLLKIYVPWGKFSSEPVIVEVENVVLMLNFDESINFNNSKDHYEINNEKFKQAYQTFNLKLQNKLANKEAKGALSDNSLLAKIWDNIKISIKNVHLRFEQGYNSNRNPCAIGINIKSMRIFTVNQDKKEAFVKRTSVDHTTHKLLEIEDFIIYNQSDLKDNQKLSQHQEFKTIQVTNLQEELINRVNEDSSTDEVLKLTFQVEMKNNSFNPDKAQNPPLCSIDIKLENLPIN